MKRWLIMIGAVVALVVVAGGLWGYNLSKKIAAFKTAGQPKMAVTTTVVQPQQWRDRLQAVGSVRAVRGADLAPEVAGIVDVVHFESGEEVKAGTILMEMRAADERARLETLRAAADLAESVYQRNLAQFEAKAISRAQLDSDAATLKGAKAQVAQQQALLDKKIIRAPFSGRLGIREVDEGQYIAAGTKVVTLQALDPIHVDFSLPQQSLASLRSGLPLSVKTDVYANETFTGKVTAIDPAVNVETRNVQVRATLKNPDRKLLPGMFARVEVEVGELQSYLTLPQTAITYNPYGEFVFVVSTPNQSDDVSKSGEAKSSGDKSSGEKSDVKNSEKQLVAKQLFVKVGPKRGDQVAILSGIKSGDQVVTSGQLKLKNGSAVVVNNSVQPLNDPAPTPQEH